MEDDMINAREQSANDSKAAGTPEGTHEMRLDDDHDLARIGGWMLGLGGLAVASGIVFLLAGGIMPALLVVAAGVICAALGGVALALVAHHQG